MNICRNLEQIKHELQPTPSAAWVLISKRSPDELYRGVTVNVGGLGAAGEGRQLNINLIITGLTPI